MKYISCYIYLNEQSINLNPERLNAYYVTNDYITQKSLYNLYGKKFQQWWSTIQSIQHEQPPPVSIYDIRRRTSNSWVPLVEQELLTLPEHLSSPPVFSGGVRVTRYLVLCVCFVDRCLSFVIFLLAIVLSVLLRFTDFDYPFEIVTLFLEQAQKQEQWQIRSTASPTAIQIQTNNLKKTTCCGLYPLKKKNTLSPK